MQLKSTSGQIELEPYGVTPGVGAARPVMLFREINGQEVLPVWMSPIDAGIALTQHHVKSSNASPHDLTLKVLGQLGVKLEACVFTKVSGHHQFVELRFSGSRKLKTVSARADQALSFCLQAGARFFCERSYIQESKVLNAEMAGVERDLRLNPAAGKNRHPYIN